MSGFGDKMDLILLPQSLADDDEASSAIHSSSSFAKSARSKGSKYELDPYEHEDDDVKSKFESDSSSSEDSGDDDDLKRTNSK
jgi:hypothetical protein